MQKYFYKRNSLTNIIYIYTLVYLLFINSLIHKKKCNMCVYNYIDNIYIYIQIEMLYFNKLKYIYVSNSDCIIIFEFLLVSLLLSSSKLFSVPSFSSSSSSASL